MLKDIEGVSYMQPGISAHHEGSAQPESGEHAHAPVGDPRQCTTKGRPRGKRLKSIREQKWGKKPRRCRTCLRVILHDSRNCPNNLASASKSYEEDPSGEESDDEEGEDSC